MGKIMLLELNNLTLQQGNFKLQAKQLSLAKGELYILQGENGSGKSTLLRLLALLQKPTSGKLVFEGTEINWYTEVLEKFRREITLVEQNPWLFRGNVAKNLSFGLKIRGIKGALLDKKIDQALNKVGLCGFQTRPTTELSGGEARRVALARALCLQPKLLLLDEPTANLDSGQIETLEQLLSQLPSKGITVVISSHDQEQSGRLNGKLINIDKGQVLSPPETHFNSRKLRAVS